jgi:hypothetical protein
MCYLFGIVLNLQLLLHLSKAETFILFRSFHQNINYVLFKVIKVSQGNKHQKFYLYPYFFSQPGYLHAFFFKKKKQKKNQNLNRTDNLSWLPDMLVSIELYPLFWPTSQSRCTVFYADCFSTAGPVWKWFCRDNKGTNHKKNRNFNMI